MKVFVVALLLVAALVHGQDEIPELFMTGGQNAAIGEFPAAVFIRSVSGVPQPFCGGTIVDRQHILTSARCVLVNQTRPINPFWFTVIAGDTDIMTPTIRREERSVVRIYVHPQFEMNTGRNDLAVLRVDRPYPAFHNTIDVATRNNRLVRDGTQCRLAAWGAVNNLATAQIQSLQRALNVPILSRVACNAPAVHNNRVLDVHLCAGSITTTNPAAGACNGNIGSGLYCDGTLTGVLTFGLSCGGANQPGVYMDLSRYNDWIAQQFTRTDNPMAT